MNGLSQNAASMHGQPAGSNLESAVLTALTNQLVLGFNKTTTISDTAPAASFTATIPDAGGNTSFDLISLAQTITALKTYTAGIGLNASGATNTTTLNAAADGTGTKTITIPNTAGQNA